ncbi:MAG TPA: DinB family protein [Thermoanaerobaculia bacterium]
MADETSAVALDALRLRITRIFPEQIRACLDQLTDEEIWSRPNEQSNSIGNLVLHVAGSLDHYLNRALGGLDFNRDRPAEFAERRRIPKDELRRRFDTMVSHAEKTFASLTPARLGDPSPEPKMNRLVVEDLIGVAVHFATHTGQIVWITKMIKGGGSLDEIWMRAHKRAGAWRG